MKSVPSYGKVLTIGAAMTENALSGEVVIQEKVDGSLFGFGVTDDDQLTVRSKGKVMDIDGPDAMFLKAVDYVKSIKQELLSYPRNDIYFYCEYLQKPKHNVLSYEKIPQNHLVLFDALVGGKWADRAQLLKFGELWSIDVIPELYRGEATPDTIKSLLGTQSFLGKEIIEGVVIKNYNQNFMLGGQIFTLFTKYVREEFKERHVVEWRDKKPRGQLDEYLKAFKSEARWQKAIIHAKELGKLQNAPQDIGMLLEMIQRDVEEEEKENIKDFLYKCFIKDILRSSTKDFPMWYKDQLLSGLEPKVEE